PSRSNRCARSSTAATERGCCLACAVKKVLAWSEINFRRPCLLDAPAGIEDSWVLYLEVSGRTADDDSRLSSFTALPLCPPWVAVTDRIAKVLGVDGRGTADAAPRAGTGPWGGHSQRG